MAGRTPYITDQNGNNLFRVYMRAEGTSSNNYYVVIKDVKLLVVIMLLKDMLNSVYNYMIQKVILLEMNTIN